ncbi:FMN-binding negative transcriptional regulator [Chitinophaga horti]|uniref:FMN-binding negative transcriptional regulator n=1 Tax=Chitinophaga horti TaxID=2920382 RepID=A0ABY6J3C1_9BACT|nr:FMN-binding negative transcriptional regulator [Chitinophaga horti]UYQ94000.1 FMN-binding negative transcriptional regulator [Chitinophaga horti]
MYTPKKYQETDWQLISGFVRENSFGMLVSVLDGRPAGTHLPLELQEKMPGEWVLEGHLSAANPQRHTFASGQPFLAVFTAAHSYISSSWYEKEKIPTWNYMAVHIYGQLRIQTESELRASLERLMDTYEAASRCPVHISDVDPIELQKNIKGIVGFELKVEEVQSTFKLSQNRHDADYFSVVTHLKAKGDEHSRRIAEEMENRRPQ